MPTIQEIRKELRKQNSITAGEDGEKYAIRLLSNSGCKFERVTQGKFDLSQELKKYGGKRPDFIIDARDNIFLLADVKYHSTENCTTFKLKDSEIGKYRKLSEYCKDRFRYLEFDVVFMVFPKEKDGNEFVWVHLDEFLKGTATTLASEPATEVSLLNRQALWYQNA